MKVGKKYEYPDWRLSPTLVENLRKMYGRFGLNKIEDKKMLAVFLGHKGPSGGFNSKIAAMKTYGLISGRGFVQVTELGKRIVYPDKPNEAYEAVKEAVNNIPLWRQLYEKYTSKGVELPDEDFWVDLQEIAELVPDDAKKASKTIRNDYLDDIQYLNSLKEAQIEVEHVEPSSKIDTPKAKISDIPAADNVSAAAAEIVSGLMKLDAFKVAKDFIDFIEEKKKSKEPKETCEKKTEN
jgi:anti-sigma28 factor (negative regulator of flagellin synthesis)